MVIFCDLDEVLEDFIGGAIRLHGYTREQLEALRPPGEWAICRSLGLTNEQLWEPILDLGLAFWQNLEPLPWYKDLIALLYNYVGYDDLYIVSSIGSETIQERHGKLDWISTYLPDFPLDNVFFHSNKSLFAYTPRAVLLDDKEENLIQFIYQGGKGIPFPSMSNAWYEQASNPLPHVERSLKTIALQTN